MLDVNVMGVVHGCYFFVPKMVAAGGARQLVNVASMAGVAPAPNLSAYAASKFAVMSLSDVLKMELDGTGVGVTTVCPGIVNTEITISQLGASTSASRGQVQRVQAYCNARGCEPAVVAERIVDAVRLGRDIVLVGPFARLLYHMNRVSRELTRRLTLFHCRKRGFN